MSLTLHVAAEKWRTHLATVIANSEAQVVPVIKGNGYGFGIKVLAQEAKNLNLPVVAVATIAEAEEVQSVFPGEILLQKSSASDWIDKNLQSITERGIDTNEFNNSVWISHISEKDLNKLKNNWPQIIWKVRIGTDLWLGDRGALKVKAQVLDLHAIQRPTRVGYRQYLIGRGWLLVVSGGTSNGIGLEVATPKRDFLSQVKTLTKSFLNLFGWNPSPFTWNGKNLEFAEAPHMHVSLLTLKGKAAPKVGSELDVDVRFTTTAFDQVVFD